MLISSISTRSGRLYMLLFHLANASAVSLESLGYSYCKFLQPCYKVVARYSNGTYGRVRHTKDVIIDMNVNFHSMDDTDFPSE